jgi:hypothetical protein
MGILNWIEINMNSKSKELLEDFINDIDFDEVYEEEIMYDDDDKLYYYSYTGKIYNGYKLQGMLEEKILKEEYEENIEVYFGCINIEDIEMKKL